MGIRVKVEMRKINGLRFARFTLVDSVHTDSQEETLLASALRECDIGCSDNAGIFKKVVETSDGLGAMRIGGVDIPAESIKEFTTALMDRGFEVT